MRRLLLVLFLVLPAVAADYPDTLEDDDNADGVPDGWFRLFDERTHPLYNPIAIDPDVAHTPEGKGSVRLTTRGLGVAILSAVPSPRMVRVDARKGYTFSVWTRTKGLVTSRAFATLQWLDRLGAPLALAPPQRTDSVGATTPWTQLTRFERVPDQACFVRFGLHLEGGDLEGSAWFDDLVWHEETRVVVEDLSRQGFVVREGGVLRLTATAEDLELGDLEVALWAHEYDGRDVPISVEAASGGWTVRLGEGELTARHPAHVPRTRTLALAYRVEGVRTKENPTAGIPTGYVDLYLSIRQGDLEVARRRIGIVSPPKALSTPEVAADWGVELTPFTSPEVADRLAFFRLGRARVQFWKGSMDREAEMARSGATADLLYRLTRSGLTVTGSLSTPPDEFLPEGSGPATMAQFLSGPQETWRHALVGTFEHPGTFEQYREAIQEWRLGDTKDTGYEGRAGLDDLARLVQGAIAPDLPNLSVTFPLPIADVPQGVAQLATAKTLSGIDFYLPGDLPAEEARDLLAKAAERPDSASVTLGLEELASGSAGESFPAQAADLWKKLGLAAHLGVRRIYVTPLVSSRAGLYDLEGNPTPLHSALSTIHCALAKAQALLIRPFDSEDLEQLVFRWRDDTFILAWRKTAGPPIVQALYLGADAKALRVDGRVMSLATGADGVTTIAIGQEPVLLYGIDTALFDTLETVKFVPDTVNSKSGQQRVTLQMVNQFDAKMTLKSLEVEFPPYWKPAGLELGEIEAKQTKTWEVPILLPESQVLTSTGAPIHIHLGFLAGGDYSHITVDRRLKVASESGVELSVEPRWAGDVLEVAVKVKNGDAGNAASRAASYVLYVGVEGFPVQSDVTGTIGKGAPWTKVYKYPGSDALVGTFVHVKMNEPRATTFLTKTGEVPKR